MARRKMTEEEKREAKLKRDAAKAAIQSSGTLPSLGGIDVSEKPIPEKKSFFERMTNTIENRPKPKRRTKKLDSNIITKAAPLVISTFIATYSRNFFKDAYKGCAPTPQEVTAMISPYFNILSRYVEITGHMSENTIDIITALLASIIYGTRAYVTYTTIQEKENDRSSSIGNARNNANGRTEAVNSDTFFRAEQPIRRSEQETDTNNGHDGNENTYAEYDVADDTTSTSDLTREEATRMAQLFKRDISGRKQMGLLPRDL